MIITMMPHMRIVLGEKPANVGTDLNTLRMRLMKAVIEDAAFQPRSAETLVGTNGRIRYGEGATALGAGRLMEGDMVMIFHITYQQLWTSDRRELIIERLKAIGATIVETSERNLDDVSACLRPAIITFDGDEVAHDSRGGASPI